MDDEVFSLSPPPCVGVWAGVFPELSHSVQEMTFLIELSLSKRPFLFVLLFLYAHYCYLMTSPVASVNCMQALHMSLRAIYDFSAQQNGQTKCEPAHTNTSRVQVFIYNSTRHHLHLCGKLCLHYATSDTLIILDHLFEGLSRYFFIFLNLNLGLLINQSHKVKRRLSDFLG